MADFRRIVVGAAAAILFYQLILPPVVGLADNGDFAKVIGRFELHPKNYRRGDYIDQTYTFDPGSYWVGDFHSSEILLTLPALWLNSLLSKGGAFDIRMIGIVHAAIFLLALWMFVPLLENTRRAVRIAIGVLALLIYCDVMYVSGFNSFYMDEPAYLFALLAVVLYLRVLRWHRRSDLNLLLASGVLMASAKTQHAPLGIILAVLLFAMRKYLWPSRTLIVTAGAACILLTSSLMIWRGSPPDYAGYPFYNVVFQQILPHSKNVERTLADLGLDDSYRRYIGMNSFYPGSRMEEPAFHQEFMRRVTLRRLGVFYLTHPRDAYEALRDSLKEAGRQRIFGTFDLSAGYPPLLESAAFAWWSDFKKFLFYRHGPRLLFTFLGTTAIVSWLLWRLRKMMLPGAMAAGFALMAMAWTELLLSSMLDCADIARHHMVFFELFDTMLIALVYLAAMAAQHAGRKKRWPARRVTSAGL